MTTGPGIWDRCGTGLAPGLARCAGFSRARLPYGTALTLVLERMHPSTAGLPSLETLSSAPVQVPKSWLKSDQSLTRRVSRNGNRGAGRRQGRRA